MLAFEPESAVETVLRAGLRPRTPATIVDPALWRASLDEVRRRGYAIDDEQSEQGMRSIAAPIRDASGRVVASVGLAGPVQRLSNDVLARFTPFVVEAAQVISTRLGHRPTSRSVERS